MSYPSSYDNIATVTTGAVDTSSSENVQTNALNSLENVLGLNPNSSFANVAAAVATLGNKLLKAGDTLSGNLSMNNSRVTGLGTPSAATDGATKGYVDAAFSVAYSYPWLIDINVFPTAISQTNWDTIFADNAQLNGFVKLSGGNQNDEINFDLVLAAGAWTFELFHAKASNLGIYSVQINGVEQGTIDGYSATSVNNVRTQISNITIAATSKVRLKLKMTGKNTGSSAYYGYISHIQLRRTA